MRLTSQIGDGLFQAGLASLFFFNPQKLATAADIAIALAVLLLPFTLVGPFAGVLIDRWYRRTVLVVANALRAVLTLVIALLVVVFPGSWSVYVGALIVLGINRFLLSALSAALPHTLPAQLLLMANSIIPTLGGFAAAFGAVAGFVVAITTPEGELRNALSLVTASFLFVGASILACRFSRQALGPDRLGLDSTGVDSTGSDRTEITKHPLGNDIFSVVRNLVDAGKYLLRERTPAHALAIMAGHRFIYGMNFIALILISRNTLADPHDYAAGLGVFAAIASVSIVGNVLAIVVIPALNSQLNALINTQLNSRFIARLKARFNSCNTPAKLIIYCLYASALSQVIMVFGAGRIGVSVSAILLGFGVQGAKISVDTIVQRDTTDTVRGRVFSLYDMLFNSAFVGAGAIAAVVIPDSGWSATIFGLLAVSNVVMIWWYQGKIREIYNCGMTQL
ncbi:MFS family permease [Arcanobacterium pluranimalium]|uniref:MFS transporter n=1 Tax=Arcanobacterium pluranimalium TaxID=108028 RepID=UPI0019593BA0|nr:MFS transporter [Arcanobacterium pluranimalium]MBM7824462.1 MFS family permease [Arcanobacterium pluranimalium]